ncbi:MAG TPA: hypothetical protein VGR13_08385 [Actinomycetota bacterium]|jgi:hypothetical protein|nr:hypothetical protein [Actinomycetota bacterium]
MKARRALVTAAAAAVILGTAGVGHAASPPSGSIGPSDPSDSWAGKHFALGSVPLPGLCNQETCDYFDLTVSVPAGYWDSHTGRASISIGWPSSSDNFDLYVYKGGKLLKSSTQALSTSEAVSLSNPGGTYEVRVVPVLVTDSGYSGSAKFSSEKKPPPPPPPPPSSPPPPPSGGGGGGGGDSGGGSGGSGGSDPSGFGRYDGPSFFPPSYYGGGTVYFGPQDRTITSKQTYYGQASPQSTTGQKGSTTNAQPVALTVPRLSPFIWLLLPLGMIVLAAAAYAVFEPEPEVAEEPLPEPEWRSLQPILTPAPIALAGVMLRTATRFGKAAHRGFGRVLARRRKVGPAQP